MYLPEASNLNCRRIFLLESIYLLLMKIIQTIFCFIAEIRKTYLGTLTF